MLLEFRIKNYKSFLEENTFSMTKAPKQSDLNYSLLHETIDNEEYIGLSSSVIYGPNASGKTNIIGAMEVFKSIIKKGTILDDINSNWLDENKAIYLLNLIPNSLQKENNPIEFYIKFTNNSKLFEYLMEIDIGKFMVDKYDRRIRKEKLCVNNLEVFSRNFESLDINYKNLKKIIGKSAAEEIKEDRTKIAQDSLSNKELFLTAGFKTIYSLSIVKDFLNWIDIKFCIIYRADQSRLKYEIKKDDKKVKFLDRCVSDAIRKFGNNSSTICLLSTDDRVADKMISAIDSGDDENPHLIPSEFYESYGTIRFANIFPYIEDALKYGMTLVVDELDASIHPMAIMNIINIFHNDDINKKNAQLIFNTHNPIYLDANLFRRDEIKFVEKDEKHNSIIYSLSDFGTAGENGVRKGEDYMKNYFVNRYGAIENIDFSPIIENEVVGDSK